MEENTNVNENLDTGAADTAATDNSNTVTMSQVDYDKAVQAAEDRVRTKLSKEIRDLKAKIPAEKTEAEIDLENRLSALETQRLEMESKEKDLTIRAALQEASLDMSIADFVKPDVDVAALSAALDKVVNAKIAAQGYVPASGHANNTGITKEQFNSLTYTEMEKIFKSNPDLAKKLMGK